jgi:hypothetical protein
MNDPDQVPCRRRRVSLCDGGAVGVGNFEFLGKKLYFNAKVLPQL